MLLDLFRNGALQPLVAEISFATTNKQKNPKKPQKPQFCLP